MALLHLVTVAFLPLVHCIQTHPHTALSYRLYNLNGPVQNIIRLKGTGDIIAAGRNAIYSISPNQANPITSVATGPVLDHRECPPGSVACAYSRRLTDNDNRILMELPSLQAIMTCGTTGQGTCSFYNSNLTLLSTAPRHTVHEYIASRGSTVAFFDSEKDQEIFVGRSYDGRPPAWYPFTMSKITIKYNGSFVPEPMKGLQIADELLTSYNVHFVHGFVHENYAYFLSVHHGEQLEGSYQTRLGRVCREDPTFSSYSEIPLKCGDHNAAQAAAFDDPKQQRNSDEATKLFVTFGTAGSNTSAASAGYVNNLTLGSALCEFSMTAIVTTFEEAKLGCDAGGNSARILQWPKQDAHGARLVYEKHKINRTVDLCGVGDNIYVEGLVPLSGEVLFTSTALLTSLLIVQEAVDKVIWTGDSNGVLRKYVMSSGSLYDVEEISDGVSVERSVIFDSESGHAYFLAGKRVVWFPVDVCSWHNDCRACTGSYNHEANCAWCGDRCAPEPECTYGAQMCQPSITNVSPLRGFIAGGIHMTVEGTGFLPHYYDDNITTNVVVGGKPCNIDFVNDTSIQCLIPPAEEAGPQNVVVSLDSAFYAAFGSSLLDNATAPYPFTYVDPKFLSLSPKSGPVSGGTLLTLIGKDLDAGFKRSITIGDRTCLITSADSESITCATPDMRHTRIHSDRVPFAVTLFVNNSMVPYTPGHGMAETPTFTFVRNPRLFSLRSDSEIDVQEGNETRTVAVNVDNPVVIIEGENLDSIARSEDVHVKVGDQNDGCHVVEIEDHFLSCILTNPEHFNVDQPFPVEVYLYGKTHVVGMIRLASADQLNVWAIVGGSVAVILVITIAIVAVLCSKKRKKEPLLHLVEFNAGGSTVVSENKYVGVRTANVTTVRLEEQPCLVAPGILDTLKAENILFPRDALELGPFIGRGHFGFVYQGTLSVEEKGAKQREIPVAVKMLRNASTATDVERFLEEALLMKDFQHENVLSLVGACIDTESQVMVITPFMKYGDLLSYIRDEENTPTVKQLITFGIDIAKGMEYLAEKRFVHRDLAARNCMLSEDFIVRVADFGLSRDIYESDYYSTDNSKCKLPIKWMAPESLEKGVYNHKTDVWSYGVVLWELLTRGVTPYPGVDNWDTLEVVKQGRRMKQPAFCPDMLYRLMLRCWDEDPKERPSFSSLAKEIPEILHVLAEKNRNNRVTLIVTYANCSVQVDS